MAHAYHIMGRQRKPHPPNRLYITDNTCIRHATVFSVLARTKYLWALADIRTVANPLRQFTSRTQTRRKARAPRKELKREFSNSKYIIDDLIWRNVGTREKNYGHLDSHFLCLVLSKSIWGSYRKRKQWLFRTMTLGWTEYCGVITQTSEKISTQYQFIYCAQGRRLPGLAWMHFTRQDLLRSKKSVPSNCSNFLFKRTKVCNFFIYR